MTIARIWKGSTPNEKAEEYLEILRRTGVRDFQATEGNRGAMVFRRKGADRTEFTVISFWDSMTSVKRFAGPEPQRAVYYADDKDYLLEFPPEVEHHDVMIETLNLEGK